MSKAKVKQIESIGIMFSPMYILKDKKVVAQKFSGSQILPTFTAISNEDKLQINRARSNLYSMLIPIHDRKVAFN